MSGRTVIELLKKWVDQGAAYESHWAWIPPKKVPLPAEAKGREIDFLVGTRLEGEALEASPAAPANRLVRRLYLDMIGLPPTAAE